MPGFYMHATPARYSVIFRDLPQWPHFMETSVLSKKLESRRPCCTDLCLQKIRAMEMHLRRGYGTARGLWQRLLEMTLQ